MKSFCTTKLSCKQVRSIFPMPKQNSEKVSYGRIEVTLPKSHRHTSNILWYLELSLPFLRPIQVFLSTLLSPIAKILNNLYKLDAWKFHRSPQHCWRHSDCLKHSTAGQQHGRWFVTYNGTASSCTLHTTFPRTTFSRLTPRCSVFRVTSANLTVVLLAV